MKRRFQGLRSDILKVTSDNKVWVLQIDTSLMPTELIIWRVDIIEYPDLRKREKAILRYIANAVWDVKTKEMLKRLPEYKKDSLCKCLSIL